MLTFEEPFRLASPCPESIASLFLESEKPPRLSMAMKLYYHVRRYIPVKVRRWLQAIPRANVTKEWYISDRLLVEYERCIGEIEWLSFRNSMWPSGKRSPLVLTHDVDSAEGFAFIPKVLEVEERYNLHSSWFIVPYLYSIDEEMISVLRDRGNEIAIHGYNHDGKLYLSRRIFDRRKSHINAAIRRYDSRGFRGAMMHRNLEWLQELDIEYDASCFDVDPFQPMPGGTHSIWPFAVGKFIELPCTLPQDHVVWIQLREKSNRIWEDKAKWLLKNRGMMLLLTHPDYLVQGDNLRRYEAFLQYVLQYEGVWPMLARELALYCRQKYA
jgi:peptidoglycan/xylan/chitin deacetylase (PgdA/CDA1 family)